jgi:hypothetical protein
MNDIEAPKMNDIAFVRFRFGSVALPLSRQVRPQRPQEPLCDPARRGVDAPPDRNRPAAKSTFLRAIESGERTR